LKELWIRIGLSERTDMLTDMRMAQAANGKAVKEYIETLQKFAL
jgi:hypothetical protein